MPTLVTSTVANPLSTQHVSSFTHSKAMLCWRGSTLQGCKLNNLGGYFLQIFIILDHWIQSPWIIEWFHVAPKSNIEITLISFFTESHWHQGWVNMNPARVRRGSVERCCCTIPCLDVYGNLADNLFSTSNLTVEERYQGRKKNLALNSGIFLDSSGCC